MPRHAAGMDMDTTVRSPDFETVSRNPRDTRSGAARARRLAARRLGDALDSGRLRLTAKARLCLREAVPMADELAMRWPKAGLPVTAALADAGDGTAARRLCRWLLWAACRFEGTAPLVSVPIPAALLTAELPPLVREALRDSGCDPARLELRLSERAVLDAAPSLLVDLCDLRDRGVGLALSDFGMELGAVALLRRLPLTHVHLDPSLTYDLTPGSEDSALVANLAEMAHMLGLRISARGSEALALRLRGLGVDEAVMA